MACSADNLEWRLLLSGSRVEVLEQEYKSRREQREKRIKKKVSMPISVESYYLEKS